MSLGGSFRPATSARAGDVASEMYPVGMVHHSRRSLSFTHSAPEARLMPSMIRDDRSSARSRLCVDTAADTR